MWLENVRKNLALSKARIVGIWKLVEILIFFFVLAGFPVLIFLDKSYFPLIFTLGKRVGDMAFILYAITLIPGMLERFQLAQTFRSVIILFRRHIGVTAFLLALVHEGYIFTFPVIITVLRSDTNFFETVTRHEVYGYIALLILFPMWLTSNDPASRKLGKYWKLLHRITYLALFMIFLHIATSASIFLAVVAFIMVLLEIVSWIVFLVRSRRQAQIAAEPPAPSSIS